MVIACCIVRFWGGCLSISESFLLSLHDATDINPEGCAITAQPQLPCVVEYWLSYGVLLCAAALHTCKI